MKVFKSIDQALFGWGSPVTLGVVRMVTGFLALVNFLMISIDFEAWFTEKGFYPVRFATRWSEGLVRLNLLDGVTDSRVTLAVYVLLCVACLFTCVGLWSRVSSIVMFVLMTTIHHRTPDILHSGDTLLRQMTFLVMVSPSGAACSIDRLVALAKGRAAAIPSLVSLWPQRLMQFQVTVVYFTTVWLKWGGSHWRDGTATWFVPQLHEFDRFPTPAFFDQQPMVAVTTYGTLVVELAIAFLAYAKPFRKWALLGGVLLHAGIEYRFNIPLFSWIMVSTYLAFFEGDEVSAWAKGVGERLKKMRAVVFLPQRARLSPRGEAVLDALDPFGLVEFAPGTGEGFETTAAKGNPYAAALNNMPVAWCFKLFPAKWKKVMDSAIEPGSGAVESESSAIPAP